MSTTMAKDGAVEQGWHVIDATNQVVGRLAVTIANILRGKHRPVYTPHVDTGEFVIVINAAKVKFTGKKLEQKTYSSYSHYPGGLKIKTAQELMDKNPERIIELAVQRMVPRTKLGRKQMMKLKIYSGPSHPHQAQNPKELKG
jgi:large subunit ribosomal protein L13